MGFMRSKTGMWDRGQIYIPYYHVMMRDENSWKVLCLVSCLDHALMHVGVDVGRMEGSRKVTDLDMQNCWYKSAHQ